ncbi:MAG: MFS transporter [Bacteroidales bacterium]|nr:MFS transporter [Bacteroidales bacterium]
MKTLRFLKTLAPIEKFAFKKHLIYSMLDGIILGVLALNEFVLIKSLHGSNLQIGLLVQLMVIVFLLSIVINEIFKRISNKQKFIRKLAIVTRLPLILVAFFPQSHNIAESGVIFQYLFLSIFFVYYMANTLIFPTINLILKKNYSHNNFGYLFSFATSANKVIMLIITFLFGLMLDFNHFAFIYIYPLLGLIGIWSIFILTDIPFVAQALEIKKSLWKSVKASMSNMIQIMRENKPYRDFEGAFMLYGIAFMITAAIITIYFEKQLNLNYSSVAFYKNAYNTIAILIIPFFGKLISKIDPRKFAAITFATMLFYILFIALTEYFPQHFIVFGLKIYYTLIIAFVFNGLFAATMSLLWYIGSAYFAKDDDAATYQSIHLTLTGVRGSFAPLIGVAFLNYIDFTGVFFLGVGLLFIAILIMFWSIKTHKKT